MFVDILQLNYIKTTIICGENNKVIINNLLKLITRGKSLRIPGMNLNFLEQKQLLYSDSKNIRKFAANKTLIITTLIFVTITSFSTKGFATSLSDTEKKEIQLMCEEEKPARGIYPRWCTIAPKFHKSRCELLIYSHKKTINRMRSTNNSHLDNQMFDLNSYEFKVQSYGNTDYWLMIFK